MVIHKVIKVRKLFIHTKYISSYDFFSDLMYIIYFIFGKQAYNGFLNVIGTQR